ncbi:Arc family DNA-binding protein [Pseudomonas cavernicola]|uniref:Arc family DNA-binding protein n=1 Tax=Pseudomonas cavernicola TaxID=2320866 RepID=A0A418XEG0_9PSED|nr:Arc family DNA-binding protein [Pseudomonas cavernicola]RJG10912.1 Arc family DNA-binding protein [Pseudomonas cavernicola]
MEEIYRSQFRFPYSLYEQLKKAADANRRSVNAELVARLEASFGPASTLILVDEYHRVEPASPERALALIEQLKGELLGLTATPKE